MDDFNNEEKQSIIKRVYDGQPKNEMDVYLMGFIERHNVARHRATKVDSRQNQSSFTFFAMKGNRRIQFCRNAFISLHAISNKAVSRLTNLLNANKSPIDGRGKHSNRPHVKPISVNSDIHDHIKSFPTYTTRYGSKPITYLNAELTVTKMHSLFLQKFPQYTTAVKYEYYLKYYNENFNYRFGRPQVDVCSTCEELGTKLKSPDLNNAAMRVAAAELIVHKRRAKKFYNKLSSIQQLSKDNPKVSGIVFDFMQNLPLPFIPVQEMFYLRKLWYFVFNIKDFQSGVSVFYNYPEGEGHKGPDEVSTFILDFIEQYVSKDVEILHVFCDACGGQNRNHTLVRMLLTLTMNGRFKEIHLQYPVRGHSFMPCDRSFGLLKRILRRHDRIYSPIQYKEVICNAKQTAPGYIVTDIDHEDIVDFKTWWPQYFKKSCQSKKPNRQM